MDQVLIDTNVLVYSCDRHDLDKQQRAFDLMASLQESGSGCIGVQSLAEFFSSTTGGRAPLLSVATACARQAELARMWRVLDLTPAIALEAAAGVRDHRLNYWDAQIWATARLHQIPLVLSEDFQDGQWLEGVRFRNPFALSFDLRAWTKSLG
jgi:predicted nucleic acid-binding protein